MSIYLKSHIEHVNKLTAEEQKAVNDERRRLENTLQWRTDNFATALLHLQTRFEEFMKYNVILDAAFNEKAHFKGLAKVLKRPPPIFAESHYRGFHDVKILNQKRLAPVIAQLLIASTQVNQLTYPYINEKIPDQTEVIICKSTYTFRVFNKAFFESWRESLTTIDKTRKALNLDNIPEEEKLHV